ncbi:hypothetical protein Mapa_016827 [Marchantia paleacea]|nr:hypothetical protein Mapa_016827 [Marchantia paleacea]
MASFMQSTAPTGLYASVPTYEDVKKKERHRAMEDYGYRPDVYDMLFRFLNDLLTTQPKGCVLSQRHCDLTGTIP